MKIGVKSAVMAATALLLGFSIARARHEEKSMASATSPKASVVDVGNTLCPVSGKPVDGEHHYDCDGSRHNLCSSECAVAFAENPQKYAAVSKNPGTPTEPWDPVDPTSPANLRTSTDPADSHSSVTSDTPTLQSAVALESAAPESAAPESAIPENSVPENSTPENSVPEHSVPSSSEKVDGVVGDEGSIAK